MAPTTRNLILIPIQIGLVANFDTVIEFLLLGEIETKAIKDAAKQMELAQHKNSENGDKENFVDYHGISNKEIITSISLRVYAYGLATTILIFALNPEATFEKIEFMLTLINNAAYFTPVAPCDKVYFGGLLFPLILSSIVVILRTVFTAYHDKSQKKTIAFFILCCFHIAMGTCFVLYSWIPIALIIFETQFRSL